MSRAQFKAYYASHKEQRNKAVARNIARLRAKRAKLIAEFKSKPCTDCGKCFHFAAMDFDHLPGRKKLGNITELIQNGWAWKRILAEIEKCELVCSNCHRVRTWNRQQAVSLPTGRKSA